MLKIRIIFYVLGWVSIFSGALMLPSLILSIIDQEAHLLSWICCSFTLLSIGFLIRWMFSMSQELKHRDCFCIVTLSWIFLAFYGSIPYVFTGTLKSWVDAFFESSSGFTTTGATVIQNLNPLPRSLLFWRSLTNWVGGMGVIVLSVSILPFLGIGGMQLFSAEAPGPINDKLTPRIASTAKILWKIYLMLTSVQAIILTSLGMSFFDAICHSFSTLATGGFSTKNSSIMAYHNFSIECVTMIFMFLASINFGLHYRFFRGGFRHYLKNSEFKFYLSVLLIAFIVIGINTYGTVYQSISEMLRYVSFQILSISTTTGFVTFDFEQWPNLSKIILMILMLMGGCAGSTAGGIKALRILIVIRFVLKELRKVIHPRAILTIKLSNKIIDKDIVSGILGFFALSVFLITLAITIVGFYEKDFLTAFSSTIACFCNIGPGLSKVGAIENYSHLSGCAKFILTGCMLMGRLELFTVVVLFLPEFWKK